MVYRLSMLADFHMMHNSSVAFRNRLDTQVLFLISKFSQHGPYTVSSCGE